MKWKPKSFQQQTISNCKQTNKWKLLITSISSRAEIFWFKKSSGFLKGSLNTPFTQTCIYIYVCIYICMYISRHIQIHTYIYIYTYVDTDIDIDVTMSKYLRWSFWQKINNSWKLFDVHLNLLSANPTKWLNILNMLLPTNCLSVFDILWGWCLKG